MTGIIQKRQNNKSDSSIICTYFSIKFKSLIYVKCIIIFEGQIVTWVNIDLQFSQIEKLYFFLFWDTFRCSLGCSSLGCLSFGEFFLDTLLALWAELVLGSGEGLVLRSEYPDRLESSIRGRSRDIFLLSYRDLFSAEISLEVRILTSEDNVTSEGVLASVKGLVFFEDYSGVTKTLFFLGVITEDLYWRNNFLHNSEM